MEDAENDTASYQPPSLICRVYPPLTRFARHNGRQGGDMGDKGGKKDKEKGKQQQLQKQKQEAQRKQEKARPRTP